MKFRQFLKPPVFPDEERTRIANLINAILWSMLAILMGLFAFTVYILVNPWPVLFVIVLAMTMAGFGLIMIHQGRVRSTAFVVSGGHWLLVTALLFAYGSVLSPGPINYVGSILIVSLLLGGRLGLVFAVMSSLTTFGLALAETNNMLPPTPLIITPITVWVVFAANFIFVAVLAGLTHRSTTRALAMSRQNERALEGANVRLKLEVSERMDAEAALQMSEVELRAKSESLAQTVTLLEEESAVREHLNASLLAKNEELERFTYTVSHDLKSPLITIQGFSGFVERSLQAGDYEQMPDDIARIRTAAHRMENLLDDLLELSRIGRMVNPPQWVSMDELVETAVSTFITQIEIRGIKTHIQPDMPDVYGDRMRLAEVWQNLIENAIKYMGDQRQPRIDIGAASGADQTTFYVRDNGIGIAPQDHDKVFGLFDRLDNGDVEGTGVGLALVKRIVEVHNGRLWLESAGVGRGSTFYFTLPMESVGD